ncbi:ATP-binding cassette sub-family A member 3 [Aplysia californica]|uniref:ATP-binding cassette sub-family A member 3 n=1 Tax=Aplysia californica TaxID=6500 RepID=A0ABM1A6J1_APLCA|nr:ATP-binding cassette sub-family A member 3 [Aplysia californica]
MGFGSQLKLLLWKNWLLQKRKICVSIFEVILPILFACIILAIRALVEVDDVTQPTTYPPTSTVLASTYFPTNMVLGYAPSNSETDKVMTTAGDLFQNYTEVNTSSSHIKNFTLTGFDTEEEALDYFRSHSDKMRHLIVFDNVTMNSTSLQKDTRFTVRPYTGDTRWRTKFTFPFFQTNTPREDQNEPPHMSRGVIYMQRLVGEALTKYWVEMTGGDPSSVKMDVQNQRIAYPPYFKDPMIGVIQNNLPLFIVLSFILSVIVNTKNLVYEKEKKLKESMKLMGLRASVHWLSWFITFLVYMVPAMIVYALLFGLDIMADKGPVLANSDASLFFVFLLFYAFALISFCFMVSTFVQKANVGAALSGILFFGFFFPYYFITPSYETLDKEPKLAASLLFNCAMALGANVIGIYEGTGEGAHWGNFHKPATVDDNLSLLECMIMLLVDTGIHLLITWYLDNVWPGEFGVPKPPYFCFTKSYWCGAGRAATDSSLYEAQDGQNRRFEKEPTGVNAGIQIKNLKKRFGPKVAVAGTSLNMFEGQISVLLGHNGAGKTTTMSMLTGFIPPTSGTAVVNGYDICDNIDGVRSSLGLCPQHNILFDTMTVNEHLEFFARLKGAGGPKLTAEVIETAKEVGLEAKMYAPSSSLSGGQKRKLSVGIALIGGSKVVILDEPTSGMDPGARRQTWNVLQRARQNRTLVLSTHYMDEADLLGDRIAIMAEGVLKCCGSSMFLKKLYGAGYHLVVVKDDQCDINILTDVIQSFVASAELETIINREVSYLLPDNESSKFASLFRELESKKEKLGITSFGTSATTMEEVFLKVGDNAYDDEDSLNGQDNGATNGGKLAFTNPAFDQDKSNSSLSAEMSPATSALGAHNKVDTTRDQSEAKTKEIDIMSFNKGFKKRTGMALEMSRMRGLFVKKAIHTWRNRVVTLVQLLLPVIFTILGLAADEARPQGTDEPPLTFDLAPFEGSYVPYTSGLNPSALGTKFGDLYAGQFGPSDVTEVVDLSNNKTFNDYTLKRADELGTSTFNKKVIVGMELISPNLQADSNVSAIAFYNGQPYHAQPIAVNYLMNTFLQYFLNDSSYSLQTEINPMPKDENDAAEFSLLLNLSAGFSVGFFISFGMAFLTTMFIFFLIKERQVGSKHMQIVSGVGPITYWLPTFLWDFINYIIPSLLLLVVFAAYQKTAYLDDGRWALVILTLAVYGWAVLPFMYAIQFAFKSPPTGVVLVIMLNIITGLVTTLVVFVLQIPGLNTEDIAESLNWVFMALFPNYNMGQCFINIYTNYLNIDFCEPKMAFCPFKELASPCCPQWCLSKYEFCVNFDENYLAWDLPGIGSYLVFMAIQGVLYILLVLLIEFHVFQRIWYLIRGAPNMGMEPASYEQSAGGQAEDSDVAAERQRVNSSPASVLSNADSLLLVNLFKRYGTFVAVDHICVGVPEQECFGLLGQNGAGKTTTFKMLTGDVMVTGGNAYLKGHDVRSEIKKVQANMGYCPQFDALIDQMTGRETLTMYARLRGVPEKNIKMVVNFLLDILMLRPHADKLAGQYSGGNKRKLSTAMALVGDPPFIMLDEPSSGMDPKARRQLWNVLSQVRASGRTLVLTSHSMEECDALCTRIAIMVNGKFMCLGSPQHLKNKFGQGYTLIVQLGVLDNGYPAPNQPVIEFILQNFPGAKVFDDHQGYVHFQVPDANIHLADVFELMETTKQNLNVEDYSVHQTTLEQVFLTFTRSQVVPKEEKSYSMATQVCCFCCLACGCYK